MSTTNGTIESVAKLEATPQGRLQRWADEITAAEKEMEKFYEQARRVVKRYIDERDAVQASNKWFNIFNANVGILEASLYAQIPKVSVARRFNDMDDDIARVASTILERSIMQDMHEPDCDFDQVMRQAVSDRLVAGLGTAWVRLEVETKEQVDPVTGEVMLDEDQETPLEEIADQEVAIDYTYWEDFLWSPCRTWGENRWVARKVYLDRDACIKRFGEEIGRQIPLNSKPEHLLNDPNTPKHLVLQRACIYEIWDKQTRQVIWYSKGVEQLLDEKKDPLGLEGFYPCPKPLFANLTTSNCKPKPDFVMLQDQYYELDEVNNRISLLVIACKVTGVYDRGADGVQRMLTEGFDNTLIPVDNWAMFAEKGGVKGAVDWLPLDVVVQALDKLSVHREIIKQQIYELTGINDVVRGNTKASETLGAQELKSKYASARMQKLQEEVVRFATEILRIKAEILVGHVEPNILSKQANVDNMPEADKELVIPALELIKSGGDALEWRIVIESDAMAQIDFARQKQERSEFLNSVATFLQSASTVGQGSPQLIPLMLQLLKFGVAGFRVSRDVEGIFDRYIKEFNEELETKKNAPPQPDPEMEKMQAEAQIEMQMKQTDQQMKVQESQQKVQLDQIKAQNELAMKQQEDAMKLQMLQKELEHEAALNGMRLQFEQQMNQIKLASQAQITQMKLESQKQSNEMAVAKAAAAPGPEAQQPEKQQTSTKRSASIVRDSSGKVSGIEIN